MLKVAISEKKHKKKSHPLFHYIMVTDGI